MDELERFLAARNKALSELDIGWARKNTTRTATDEVLLISLHKARYSCTAIAKELRHSSAQWLRERGYHGAMGDPLLPEGELPE